MLISFPLSAIFELLKRCNMKILVEVPSNKVEFFLELLENVSFIKNATPLTDADAAILANVKQAVQEMKLIKKGKLKAITAEELINEL